MKGLFKKTRRSTAHGIRQFIIICGFIYIGRRKMPKKKMDHYQLGYQIMDLPPMYKNFDKKPGFSNPIILNIIFFIPYLLFLLWGLFKIVCLGIFWLLTYSTVGYIKHGLDDFGWSKHYLVVPIVFWKILAFTFILLYLLK